MTCLIRLVHFAVERAGQLLLLESPVKNHLRFLVFEPGQGLFSLALEVSS